MGDFDIFLNSLKRGDMRGVIRSFHSDFLERAGDYKMRPIHYGCSYGHVNMAKFLVAQSCDIESQNCYGWRPIHFACWNGHVDIVKFLIELNCEVECKSNQGMKPIHLACHNGHIDIAKFLIENNCEIECKTNQEWRPIHLASNKGHVDIVKCLIEHNCEVECKANEGWRPIHQACWNGDIDMVRFLIRQKCDIECKDNRGWRPIHLVSNKGHVDIAKFLIENNCDIECRSYWGWRPIHQACFHGHFSIVKLLVRNGCEITCRNSFFVTPLKMTITKHYWGLAEFLMKAVKLTQFFDCVRKNECQILKGLKTADVVTREEPRTGLSFLEVVLEANATEVLKYFLDKRVEDEEIPPIKLYIENCSRPEAVELIQEFFLYRSIRYHHADGFELSCLAIIVNGHRNLVSTSFVEIAAEHGTSAFISEILKKSIYNKEEWTRAKNVAILKDHNKILNAILDREILLMSRAKGHFSEFHNAICDNDPDLMRYIFNNGLADPNFNNEVIGTGLSLAHMLCHANCIQTLQQFNVDVNTQNKYAQSPLHEAISSGMTDHCSYLISQTRDIDKPGFMGLSALQCAVMEGCKNLCDELVKNGADCMRYAEDFKKFNFKDTALPISTRENAVTLCIKIHETIFPCFLEALDFNKVNCSDGNENTLLHLAVKALLSDLCKTLINCGANVGSINAHGNPPLLELFSHSNDKIVNDNLDKIIKISDILIDAGADINEKSLSGVTVFGSASQCNSEKLMLYILSKDPDMKFVTENDFRLSFTNTWFAYAKDLLDLIPEDSLKSFISTEIFHLVMPNAESNLLKSMFMKASSDVKQSIIEDLLLHFATKDEYDIFVKVLEIRIIEPKLFPNGETLFTSLLKEKNVKYCRAIIRHAANKKCLNLANVSNQIPLQIAIEIELYDLLCPLIFECGELNHEDFLGRTPLLQLFKKLTNSTDSSIDEKLMTAVKTIISNGGDIFKETLTGLQVINSCTRLPLRIEIEAFQISKRNKDFLVIEEQAAKNICSICMDRELDCVFECGHTLCTPCGVELFRCPMCNSEIKNRIKMFIS